MPCGGCHGFNPYAPIAHIIRQWNQLTWRWRAAREWGKHRLNNWKLVNRAEKARFEYQRPIHGFHGKIECQQTRNSIQSLAYRRWVIVLAGVSILYPPHDTNRILLKLLAQGSEQASSVFDEDILNLSPICGSVQSSIEKEKSVGEFASTVACPPRRLFFPAIAALLLEPTRAEYTP
jgi:hypothetical protein